LLIEPAVLAAALPFSRIVPHRDRAKMVSSRITNGESHQWTRLRRSELIRPRTFQVHGVDASGAVVVRKAYAGRSGSILVNLAEVGDTVAVPPHHLLQNLVA
jgi:hypothetical protein